MVHWVRTRYVLHTNITHTGFLIVRGVCQLALIRAFEETPCQWKQLPQVLYTGQSILSHPQPPVSFRINSVHGISLDVAQTRKGPLEWETEIAVPLSHTSTKITCRINVSDAVL